MIYQIINNFKKHLIRQSGNSLSSKKGQTAVVLILMIAIALVIYSASLNWSRIAQYKTLTTIGSNTAAASMATMIASFGEQQLQTTMGGRLTVCKRTSLIVLIVTLIIVINVTWI